MSKTKDKKQWRCASYMYAIGVSPNWTKKFRTMEKAVRAGVERKAEHGGLLMVERRSKNTWSGWKQVGTCGYFLNEKGEFNDHGYDY